MATCFWAYLSTKGAFMVSIALKYDGTLNLENGDGNKAFRWWYVPESCQLVLLFDYGMRDRPSVILALAWIEGKLWADQHGNYLVLATDTRWPLVTEFRVAVPLTMLPRELEAPVMAYHWLSGSRCREFIVGFQDHGCCFYGRDEQWTQKHGSCRLFRFDEKAFLIVKFHCTADMEKACVSVFEKVQSAYFVPVKEIVQLQGLTKFLTAHHLHEALGLLNSYDRLNMPKVAVLPVANF